MSAEMSLCVLMVVAVCGLHEARGLLPAPLDLWTVGVHVTATAECADGEQYVFCLGGAADCVRSCGADGVPHGAELAVDGDRGTSWQSPTAASYLSQGTVSLPAESLTIDLGQEVYVTGVRVFAGDGNTLAFTVRLSVSLDGNNFTTLGSASGLGQDMVVFPVVMLTNQQQELTTDQKERSLVRYLQILLLPPLLPRVVTSDLRAIFHSISEVEVLGVCPSSLSPPLPCHVSRRTSLLLRDPAHHRLLWQRSNQSDSWILDDVMVIVEVCSTSDGCQFGRIGEDFSGTLNPQLWDSTSFPPSSTTGPPTCPGLTDEDPSLLVPPGGQILSRPLPQTSSGVVFTVQFPTDPSSRLCEGEIAPVELRLCRSIEGVLGECDLIALVTTSDCGNCLDQLTFQLRYLREGLDSAHFPANLTILDVLHDDIHSALEDLEGLEALVSVLEVVVGIIPSLPPSSLPLPPSVPRLDLQLVPTIPSKLSQLQDLLLEMPTITVVSREDLVLIYSDLRTRLESLLTEANQLRSRQRGLSSDVSVLLRISSRERDMLSSASEAAQRILDEITARVFSGAELRAGDVEREVQSMVELSNRAMGLARSNWELGEGVRVRLGRVGGLLVSANTLAAETVGVASRAIGSVGEAQEILMGLLEEASEGVRVGEGALGEGEEAVRRGSQLLTDARAHLQNSSGALPAISDLIDQLNQSVQFDRPRLDDLLTSDCPSGRDNCTAGEEHATQLVTNLTHITNSSVSVYTLRLATDTLVALGNEGEPLDLGLINETALLAQERARGAAGLLARVNTTLGGVVSIVLRSAEQLRLRALGSTSASEELLVDLRSAGERETRLSSSLGDRESELDLISERLAAMTGLEGVREEALVLAGRANSSGEVVRVVRERVGEVREGAGEIEREIEQIKTNAQTAEASLQEASQKLPLVARLLTATRDQAEAALSNTTSFIRENQRILSDIDSLISQLSDVHASVALINSPVRLSSEPAENADSAVPYLSLQLPPGNQLGHGVQFEDFDLYLWPSAQYHTPSLLFYVGPVRFPDQQNGTQPDTREDVVWVIAEEDQLRLGWELGDYHGNTTYPALLEGESQLRLTRVGSQFRLQFAPSPEPALQTYSLVNGSLLFQSSPRTAFLLGGWPLGSELGSEVRPLPLGELGGFEGQIQLALFNGGPWGLWNVRSTSPTDLIGDVEFRRNELTSGVPWHAPIGLTRTTSVLSFDGSGHLFTEQLGRVAMFSGSFFQIMNLYLRPNDASRGLVMYAYQTEISLSLEVSFSEGDLNVLVTLHQGSGREVLVNHTELALISRDGEVQLQIRYVGGFRRYTINGKDYDLPQSTARFFTNLQQVKAWFGGVRADHLDSSYVPREMSGYFGCIDMTVERMFTVFEVFQGSSFRQYYLNSPLQSRLSATCYSTVYVREVSFARETDGLAYTYLPLPPLSSTCSPSLPLSLSLSLVPLEGDGVILLAEDQDGSVLEVRLESSVLRVKVFEESESLSLSSRGPLQLGEWNYLLLSISSSSQELQLFVDGVLHDDTPFNLTGFSLDLPTSTPVGVADPSPVLFVGGVTPDFDPSSSSETFTGCMRDITFDLCPLSFQSRSLVDPYPRGVTYHSCPSVTTVAVPELPVRPDPPQQRVCVGSQPVELGATHGGFARDTHLETSNVAGLFGSEWTLSFALRQRRDGHVISVRSVSGAVVMVQVERGGGLSLTVSSGGGGGGGVNTDSTAVPLPRDVFTDVSVGCAVVLSVLRCNLTVATQPPPPPLVAEVPVSGSVFDPSLPATLGLTTDTLGNEVEGFEGCISDLAINGDTSGFKGVYTGIPCYNETTDGLGFTGISRLSEVLPPPGLVPVGVALTVRPLLETGVVLTLTTPTTGDPVLLVGLVQGELRVSQFSGDYLTLARGLCNRDDTTFELSVQYTANELTVGVVGGDSVEYAPPPNLGEFGELIITIGNLPERLSGEADLSLLLGEDMLPTAQPAGLVGCLMQLQPLLLIPPPLGSNILNGFCPVG